MSAAIDPSLPLALLGGLSPRQFMRRHWQKAPLLIRQAVPGASAPLARADLFALAEREGVESRLVRRRAGRWSLRPGPIPRRGLPPLREPGWTLLVQGLDLHVPAAHALMGQFRFIPDARLDDLMLSYASDGGGVGPHVDSYDVFLLQVHGRRRWRIGRLREPGLLPDLPLKILARFEAEEEWVLEPGDMLYLPPNWAHDGIAEGECMTCSIGFRAATRSEFGREVLQRSLDAAADAEGADGASSSPLYRDPHQAPTTTPARVPESMQAFAADAVRRVVGNAQALACSLGEWLSEPKPQVWFDEGGPLGPKSGVRLDDRSRMLWDDWHVFLNGESYRAGGRDARLMRELADRRRLSAAQRARLGPEAASLLAEWAAAGWLHPEDMSPAEESDTDERAAIRPRPFPR